MTYPCKAAPWEELDEMLQSTYGTLKKVTDDLSGYIHPVLQKKIKPEKLRHLRIVGDDDLERLAHFEAKGISRGFYLNADGSWLLVILPQKPHLGEYIQNYGPHLESLAFMNTQMYSRDWTNLSGLKELYLEDNRLIDSLERLDRLSTLERLSIVNCPRLTQITGLGKLRHLTELRVYWCENLTALPGLGNLTRLTTLEIYYCERFTVLPSLKRLTQLTTLTISQCEALTQLPLLYGLAQLTNLDLSGCYSLTQLPPLDRLAQLTKLDLSGCYSLTQLPPLDRLEQLNQLDLSKCTSLTQLPSLDYLTQLNQLDLSMCTSLTQLPPLDCLKHLTELNLSKCHSLTWLPNLKNLTKLTNLFLDGCLSLKVLPDTISHCENLRRLKLCNMDLQDLPDWLPKIADSFSTGSEPPIIEEMTAVWLYNTTVESIPDMSIFEQPYEMVREWFEKRRLGDTHPINEIRVVFLGDGEAGKSHTIARLMNDGGAPVGYVDVRTPGIVIKDLLQPVGDRDATLHLWDFGGQDILHSMHRIFLTERTFYVVLVDGSIGNQDERARYWLQNIQSFAKDAPVILVLNKLDDGLQADVNAVDLKDKYKGLKQIVKLSALQYPRERFNQEFRDVLIREIQKTKILDAKWPSSWVRVKKALKGIDENYIHGVNYMKICQDLDVTENQQYLLDWFHVLGISFCYCDSENRALEDYIVLKPNWITNALYIILFNEREGGNGGLVPINTIRNMLGWDALNKDAIKRVIPDAYYVGYDVNYVLDVFHAFHLSFRKDEHHEFFPMLADVNAKSVAKDYAEEKDCLEFNMEFDYLPNNLLHRLIVERHTELDMENVWRTGARFRFKELGYSAVVVIDGNILRFFIRHSDPMHRPNTYLTMLKAHVDRIVEKMGLKVPTCKLIYKLDGKRDEFDYEDVKLNRELGDTTMTSKAHRKKILIADILNQSAPDGLEDEQKLLDAIRKSCLRIQAEPDYYLKSGESGRGMEDKRNRRIRDDLELLGYNVKDQTQRGLSETGRGIGELDLLLYNDKKEPWTIIEALRVSRKTKSEWNGHLDKLVANYNYFDAPSLYLLTYVDIDETEFQKVWEDYQLHIPKYAPGKFTYRTNSLIIQNDADSGGYIKTAKCQYDRNGKATTAYHIFARIPTRDE